MREDFCIIKNGFINLDELVYETIFIIVFWILILNQNLRCLVARAGVRHFHTVKWHIFIMIMDKQRRNISSFDFFIKSDIGIWKCRS